MSFFVVCTFDLTDADNDDYQTAYSDLAEIGLSRTLTSKKGNEVTLPTTATAGEFNGTDVGEVRDKVANKVKKAFSARGFNSGIFISVGGNWAWGRRRT